VAPGAQWIACRNMRYGIGSVARYTACFQFSLAPTDLNGSNPDPSKAADITTNSWACDPGYGEIGCDVPSALVTVTQVLRDAGIMTVAAAGNSGRSGCNTVQYAPGTLDQAFTVGATDSANAIASFSSRGPSTFTGHLKPDVVAPGVMVRSAVPTNGYDYRSGTSMATPHVAGVVALLWSAAPWLRGQIDETEAILRSTAQPLATSETCGGLLRGAVPNNTYGYGLIDARAAVSEAHRLALSVAANTEPLYSHLLPVTYTLILTNHTTIMQTNLTLTATLPVSTVLLTTQPPALTYGDVLTWTIASLSPLDTLSVTLVVSAAPGLRSLVDYALSSPTLFATYTGQPATTFVYAHRRWMMPVYR
ncbi:MAG: S8 family serine peptidase, partial [Candidatus Roseilinea sp.]|uniref:S8 family serine peptidase n=1 Tax=Candidatus Roseilinea sp. TaxID=2838777 RepID=UPI00404A3C19